MAISDAQWQKMGNYVRGYLIRTAQSLGHNNAQFRATARWTHTLNVRKNIKLILDGEGITGELREICKVAALFHDVDHYTVQRAYHAARGAETATHFLTKQGFDPVFVQRVADAIREHDRDLDDDIPVAQQVQEIVDTLNIETRMLLDADTLDKIGVSNILQSALAMGMARRELADAAKELTAGWPVQRARLWMELLTTPTGKRLGAARFAFYEQFLAQIGEEIVVDDPYPQMMDTQEMAKVG